jgi:hypothetical protein
VHQNTVITRISNVEKKYARILKSMPNIEPSTKLYKGILIEIMRKQVLKARVHISAWAGVFIATLGSFVYSYSYIVEEITQSDFYQYLSFFFSDSSVAISYWKELALSLGDTAPLFSITLILLIGFVSLGTIKAVLRDKQKAFYQFTY